MENRDEDILDRVSPTRREFCDLPTKRRQIKFVKADSELITPQPQPTGANVGDHYLALVLGDQNHQSTTTSTSQLCSVCMLPLAIGTVTNHETSIAHQVCLPHTHPPSALDRKRKGLTYLQGYGWDPDSRKGLGVEGREGILHPIRPQAKPDRAGIKQKSNLDKDEKDEKIVKVKEKHVKLNVKQLKRSVEDDKKKRERLQRLFYTDEDVLRHLGEI